MLITDLMNQLAELYPSSFARQAQLTAWGKQFRAVVGEFEGDRLQEAWDDTMRTYDKTSFPRPADIRKHVPDAPRGDGKPRINMAQFFEDAKAETPRVIAGWWQRNRGWVEDEIRQRGVDQKTGDEIIRIVERRVKVRAWSVAQRRINEPHAAHQVEFTRDDLAIINPIPYQPKSERTLRTIGEKARELVPA